MSHQSLTVFLDKSLTSKFDKSKYKSTENKNNLTEYVSFHKVQQFNENIYKEQTNNGLINAFLLAYNNHLPLKLKPDDIHIAIQFVFSTFVNNNAEKLRDLFVEHKDKKALSVEHDSLDFNMFSELIIEEVKCNIKDTNMIDILETNYSTSNNIIKTVSKLLILNTLKEYFSYEFILGCGIPSIILDGTQDDWNLLKSKYEQIKQICNTIPNNELINWFPCMDKIMNMFVDLRMLAVNGSIDAPEHYKIFIGLPYLDISIDVPSEKKYSYYQYQDVLKKFYGGCGWSELQTTLFVTPAILNDKDVIYEILIESGLSSESFINQNNEVECNYMYDIKKKSNEYVKKINEYKEKGYYVDEEKCLKYPEQYHKNHDIPIFDIMKIFNVHAASMITQKTTLL
jgi:hypothetical protein